MTQDVQYTGNGTAEREADVRPTGFFFQMPKPVGEVYGWHGSGKGQPMCRFDTTETEMPIGTELYTTPPQRTWVGLTDREKSNLWLESRAAIPRFHTYATLVEAKLKEKNT